MSDLIRMYADCKFNYFRVWYLKGYKQKSVQDKQISILLTVLDFKLTTHLSFKIYHNVPKNWDIQNSLISHLEKWKFNPPK